MEKMHGDRCLIKNQGKGNSKYHSKTIEYEGMNFDSVAEYRRYRELLLLQRAGEIRNLDSQVKYVLVPTQKNALGKVIERECSYICDFDYEERQRGLWVHIVEDVKGFKTKDYIIKRKLMLFVHGIVVREVTK